MALRGNLARETQQGKTFRHSRGQIWFGLIALGPITLGLGGASNSIAEEMTAFALSLAVGAAFLFAGFLLATTPKTQPPDSVA